MFPPLPQEKAAIILEKVILALKNGSISLEQTARPSQERKNQGVMLGVLVCKDKEGNEVNLVTNSGNARKLKVENGKLKTENGKLKTESGKENVWEIFSPEEREFFSGGENFSSEERDSQLSNSNFQLSSLNFHLSASNFQLSSFNFQLVPPIVSAEQIEKALSENDKRIHELTEKIASESAHSESSNMNFELKKLRTEREKLCTESLEKVHALYNFHCINGKILSLKEICARYNHGKLPPTGTGDCCAPKLFDYAFSHELFPISLAETAYTETSVRDCSGGDSRCEVSESERSNEATAEPRKARPEGERPNEQGRAKQCPVPNFQLSTFNFQLTPPCDERCGILLPAMLGLRILYRDEAICVVNKESGILSVPGRGEDKKDCVESRFKRLFGDSVEIAQPAVHRLDMETSGIMILAFTKEAHRELNRQFDAKEVKKEYVALLDGVLAKKGISQTGSMELFFRLDVDNRPHQIWDAENGKSAVTQWQILGVERYHAPDGSTRNATRVLFMPHTGRTHQLRLASADIHGFGTAIIGDTLYGHCAQGERLMLHAQKITFTHPLTGRQMTIECKAEF